MACDEWRALAHLDPLQGWVGMMGEMGPGCANASLGVTVEYDVDVISWRVWA
jgi:hypothetical protein